MTTTPPTVPVPRLRFGGQPLPHERLAAAVLNSPRLLAAVPEAELRPLFVAHEAAVKAADKARLLPAPEHADAVSAVMARLRNGDQIDPAALMDELAEADRKRDDRRRVGELLASMPGRFADEITQVIKDYEEDAYDVLSDALRDLLDRAAPVIAKLNGATTADQAVASGKAAEWAEIQQLAEEMGSLRRDHWALLRASGDSRFSGKDGDTHRARAMFSGIDSIVDEFAAIARGEVADLMGRPVSFSVPVHDIDSPGHLLWVIANREVLRPRVGRPSDSTAGEVITSSSTAPFERMPRAHQEYLFARARNEAANRVASEREDRAAGIIH